MLFFIYTVNVTFHVGKEYLSVQESNLILAEHAGFCYGVKMAVDLSLDTRKDYPSSHIYILGELIHNKQVIELLQENNIHTVNLENDLPSVTNGICIIRTHGVPPETIQKIQIKGYKIVDATCPDVSKVQLKAQELAEEGYTVVIIGKEDHPEVIGIKAYAHTKGQVVVISSLADIEVHAAILRKARKIGVVIQTTQTIEKYAEIVGTLATYGKELKACNTICLATSLRQKSAKSLASEADYMIVIGGKNSANTTHLADICQEAGAITFHIEKWDEIKEYQFDSGRKIGITAGASTPDFLIQEVINGLQTKIGDKLQYEFAQTA